MKDYISNQDSLAAILKDQARRDTPAFSQELHARIMAQVHNAPQPQAHSDAPTPIFCIRPILLLAAAALLIAMTLWMVQQSTVKTKPQPIVGTPIPALPPIDHLVATSVATAQDDLEQGRYAYLDHDAQSLALYVMNQFDVSPAKP